MDRTRARQVRAAVADAGRRARTPIGLEREVADLVARVLPYDQWCGMTTDPGTGQVTGGFHDDGFPGKHLPRMLDIENGADPDVFRLRDMQVDPRAARSLSDATHGDLPASARFRDIFVPSGIAHEVRLNCRDQTGGWGVLIFMRGSDEPDFSPAEVSFLGGLSGRIAEGLRRATLVAQTPGAAPGAPGLLLLTVGERLVVDHMTGTAEQWLSEIDDGSTDGIPHAVSSLARQAVGRSETDPAVRTRVLTTTGRWITAYAERLGGTAVSVILEPSHPREVASLLADAYRLTQRERDVVALAVRGHSTAEIAKSLWLSPFTVQDHLKSAFGKVGVSGRGELAAALLFDEAPTLSS